MKRLLSLLLVSAFLILTVAGCGSNQTAEEPKQTTEQPKQTKEESKEQVFELKFADYYGPTHVLSPFADEYVKILNEKSNGRLKVQRYPAEQLGKSIDMLSIASTGTSDFTTSVLTFFAGQLPLTQIANLSHFNTAVEGSEIMRRLFKESKEIQAELKKQNVIPIVPFMVNQMDMCTKIPIRSPEDLKGVKIATSGGLVDTVVAAYGAVPITISSNDLYESVQKGIANGTLLTLPSINNFKLYEVAKFHTWGMRGTATGSAWVMNLDTWNKLPADLQKIVEEAGAEMSNKMAVAWDQANLDFMEKFKKEGMEFYNIKPEEREKWDAPLASVDQKVVKDLTDKGIPAQAVYDQFVKIAKEVTSK